MEKKTASAAYKSFLGHLQDFETANNSTDPWYLSPEVFRESIGASKTFLIFGYQNPNNNKNF